MIFDYTPKASLLATAVGLLVECPKHRGNPHQCPLHGQRGLSMLRRFEWARSLPVGELSALLERCSACSRAHSTESGARRDAGGDQQRIA